MITVKNLPESKKMTVIFRLEPGALGPEGGNYIDEFCEFAQQQLQACGIDYINWAIVPRLDKRLAEMAFQLAGKTLNEAQASQYFALFNEDFAHFAAQLDNHLEAIINQYFGR